MTVQGPEQVEFEDDRRRAARYIQAAGPLGGLFACGWAALYVGLGYPWPTWASMVVLAGFSLSSPLFVRAGAPAHAVSLAAIAMLQASLFVITLVTGGLASTAMPWMIVVPFLAVVTGGRRSGTLLFAVALPAVLVLVALGAVGWTEPPTALPYQLAQATVSWVGALVALTGGIVGYQALTEQALARTREANRTLTHEIREHERTRADLDRAHRQLLTAAHLAGMAEVATGVLHNVGNGLNAVNVSTSLLVERDHATTASRLDRLAQLLADPGGLDGDRRAAVAEYGRRLAASFREEVTAGRSELLRLRERVDHVKSVVSAQQAYARSAGHVERVEIADVIDQTLLMSVSGRQAGDVVVRVDVAPIGPVFVERHKLLQVLTNLVKNARDAVAARPGASTITVTARAVDAELAIEVSDDGLGIDADHLDRIFQHGFTTKPDGHGFGLHVSALAAIEMGGSLTADSAGVGRGATFRLKVPLRQVSDRAD
jgi:signal transduction histidine kinase